MPGSSMLHPSHAVLSDYECVSPKMGGAPGCRGSRCRFGRAGALHCLRRLISALSGVRMEGLYVATTTDPRDETHWSEVIAASAASPVQWLVSADQLRRSADVLREQWMRDLQDMQIGAAAALSGQSVWRMPAFVSPSMMMLLGLSLENIAKGLMVARNPHLPPFGPAPGARMERAYKRHILLDLLTKRPGSGVDVGAGVTLSPAERTQVERLERFVVWGGRYPVPVEAMQLHYVLPDGPPTRVSTDELVVIDPLIDRLRADLETEAAQWSAIQAAAAPVEETRRWAERLPILAALPTQNLDGVLVYVDASAPDEPGNHIACGGCHKSFMVNRRFAGALCPCGNLHYVEPRWDPAIRADRLELRILNAKTRPV